jgi:hypothetical protein
MKQIDCKHFNFGEGTCPFSTSCFYRHVTKVGLRSNSLATVILPIYPFIKKLPLHFIVNLCCLIKFPYFDL